MHNTTQVRIFAFSAALLALAFAGCGRMESSVSGTVTLDGKPLSLGTVAFKPVNGGATSHAGIHPDGSYKVSTGTEKGLPAGEYLVAVTAKECPDPNADASKGGALGQVAGGGGFKLLTPARYGDFKTSGLKFTVTKGSNRIDLPLKSP